MDRSGSKPEQLKFVLGRVESIVGKRENAGYQRFLLFLQCFQKASFSRSLTLKAPNKLWQKNSSLKYNSNNYKFMVAFVSSASGKRTMKIKDQVTRFVQPDLHLHWLQRRLK